MPSSRHKIAGLILACFGQLWKTHALYKHLKGKISNGYGKRISWSDEETAFLPLWSKKSFQENLIVQSALQDWKWKWKPHFQLVRFICKLKWFLYFIHSKDHESDPSSAHKPSAIYFCLSLDAQCLLLWLAIIPAVCSQ